MVMPDHLPAPWDTSLVPDSLDEALHLLARHTDRARIMAGGTDLLLELQRGVRSQRTLIDITRLPNLDQVTLDEHDQLHLGPVDGPGEDALIGRAEGRQAAPQMYETIVKRTPARRWGVPEDLAGIAVFLASAASDFVTGTAIPVDGGYSAQA